MIPDPEHLVALALSGALSPEQTTEILSQVVFKGADMRTLGLENVLNAVADKCRKERAGEVVQWNFRQTSIDLAPSVQ